ncbi:hypothetical protein ROZALSC1DRAFT_21121 [Rozella allomycis CSF55]|uniref:CDAN1-interacting nuclease 1 n=1 Tax=Rozella allomycis (strain CSF55) TaxID=988480 RepID=A0A4P9YND5_ROZAC|nr:hypothetical protein ROZALSC1DRAFT_21121 [Rozella allomycis CSF55]
MSNFEPLWLKEQIMHCLNVDKMFSPDGDLIRSNVGELGENILTNILEHKGIPFHTEDELRELNFHKTPDVRLEIPIAVKGRIVHWIESKALFGDYYHHKKYDEAQYSSYYNRYGPGLVIYWAGYIKELEECQDFLVLHDFPRDEDIEVIKSPFL